MISFGRAGRGQHRGRMMRGGRYFGVLAINACLLLGACGMDGGVIGYAAHNMGLQPSTIGLGPSAPSGAEAYGSRKDSFTHCLATVNASCGTPPISPPPTCAGTIMSGQSCPY